MRFLLAGLLLICWPQFGTAGGVETPRIFLLGDTERLYFLHEPEDLPPGAPVVFALHGMGGAARNMRYGLGLNEIAEKMGMAVVYPQGGYLSSGSSYWNSGGELGPHDDISFLEGLAKKLILENGYDPDRVFLMGISNGGFMAYSLACHPGTPFSAVASVIGTMVEKDWNSCSPDHPISVLHMHGTDDPLIPYQGAQHWSFGTVPSASKIVDFWVKTNGLAQADFPGIQPPKTQIFEYRNKNSSPIVQFIVMNGFGHDWPHNGNAGFSASEMVMTFFRRVAFDASPRMQMASWIGKPLP